MISEERDLHLVKEFILLPLLLSSLERDISKMMESDFKLKDIYARSFRKAQNNVSSKLYEYKQEMRQRGLKVYEQERDALGINVKYLVRGYHGRFEILFGHATAEIKVRLAEALDVDINDYKQNP